MLKCLSNNKAEILVESEFPSTLAVLLSAIKHFLYSTDKGDTSDTHILQNSSHFFLFYIQRKANFSCILLNYESFYLLHHKFIVVFMCCRFLRGTWREWPTTSHYPLQKLGVLGGDDGLAAADADVSEDPQVDASR